MTTPNEPTQLTPERLANDLFDKIFMQNPANARLAADHVIAFVTETLMYALKSAKEDPVIYTTQMVIYLVSSISVDEAARKEMLKKVGDLITNAPPLQVAKAPPGPGKP